MTESSPRGLIDEGCTVTNTPAEGIGITNPPIDNLLTKVDSKYSLVLFASQRARQINAYYSQLGESLLENVGPLVDAGITEKPLSIALREIEDGLLELQKVDPHAEPAADDEAPSLSAVSDDEFDNDPDFTA